MKTVRRLLLAIGMLTIASTASAQWSEVTIDQVGAPPTETYTIRWTTDPAFPPTFNMFDVDVGDLGLLRSTGGDYAAALSSCFANNVSATMIANVARPTQSTWFVVRAQDIATCGTWNSAWSSPPFSQSIDRDPQLDTLAAPASCPCP